MNEYKNCFTMASNFEPFCPVVVVDFPLPCFSFQLECFFLPPLVGTPNQNLHLALLLGAGVHPMYITPIFQLTLYISCQYINEGIVIGLFWLW